MLMTLAGVGCGGREVHGDAEIWTIESEELIDRCAADFDIKYSLYAKGDELYVGYYDVGHRMKVARKDASGHWTRRVLDEKVNWDSHRYISLSVDKEGTVHLSGNMHKDPLVYYRSDRSGDLATMTTASMTGVLEDSVTYPEFLQTDSTLFFHYRNGRSGDGNTYFNAYQYESGTWVKLQADPLFDGEGESNSYFKGPVPGDDGKFHLIWCWRDEPHCETNHGLYYAFSRDLNVWETPDGFSKRVPVTPEDDAFLVDDIKVREGLINGGFALGFDEHRSPVISYHKYDEKDHTNLHTAVSADSGWILRRITDWDWKWAFSGRGSIPFELTVDGVERKDSVQYLYGSRRVEKGLFKKKTMKNFRITYSERDHSVVESEYTGYPRELERPLLPGMLVHNEFNTGDRIEGDSVRYLLTYETRYPNRDKRPRNPFAPTSSPLRLVKLRKK